ncbi:hypothetical protein D3C71_617880 [compost metagenome]
MPYAELYFYQTHTELHPMPGENFQAFSARCSTGLKILKPDATDESVEQVVCDAWNSYLVSNATEITLTLKKDVNMESIYDYRYMDWKIAEVLSAKLPSVSFSSVEKAKAGSGDTFKIAKTAPDKQLVFGWANVAKEADGSYPLDWDGDVTQPEELEKAAYNFVLKYRETGEVHQGEAVGTLVESMMFTKEKQAALGIPDGIIPEAWWVGFYVPDTEVFAKIKKGEYEMFSVQGKARRTPTGQ